MCLPSEYWRLSYSPLVTSTQGQIGNPEGEDKPNKKKYDPRVWLREAEVAMVRLFVALRV